MITESSINGRWIIPFKKFGMVRVNTCNYKFVTKKKEIYENISNTFITVPDTGVQQTTTCQDEVLTEMNVNLNEPKQEPVYLRR